MNGLGGKMCDISNHCVHVILSKFKCVHILFIFCADTGTHTIKLFVSTYFFFGGGEGIYECRTALNIA